MPPPRESRRTAIFGDFASGARAQRRQSSFRALAGEDDDGEEWSTGAKDLAGGDSAPPENKQSFTQWLREAREKGDSQRSLGLRISTVSRSDLEYEMQLQEREKLQHLDEIKRLTKEKEAMRERLERLTSLANEQTSQNESDAMELRELRRMREEWEAKKAVEKKAGPGDLAWMKLKKEAERVKLLERENDAKTKRMEEALRETETHLNQRLAEAAEREEIAASKAEAAMKALETANEATKTAEEAAAETNRNKARDALFSSLRAVATDRMRQRRKSKWWEKDDKALGRKGLTAHDRSGLAMLLDAVFLGVGSSTNSGHLDSKLCPMLRATEEGRTTEAIVLHRQPRGLSWLHAIVAEMCADKLLHDQAAERLGEPPLPLADFIIKWAPSRFGMPSNCMLNMWTLHQALVTHRPRSVEAALIALFLELPTSPRALRILSFYLHARAFVAADVFTLKGDGSSGNSPRKRAAETSPRSRSPSPPRVTEAMTQGRGDSRSPNSARGPGHTGGEVTSIRVQSPGRAAAITPSPSAPNLAPRGSPAAAQEAPKRRGRSAAVIPGSANTPMLARTESAWAAGSKDDALVDSTARVKAELARRRGQVGVKEASRRVLQLTRAWEAAEHLLKPTAHHLRIAWMRELQAASTPQNPPGGVTPLRSTHPYEFHVVDFEHFLLSATVFYDFANQLNAQVQTHQQTMAAGPKDRKGGVLSEFPLAQSLIAVLRRSVMLSAQQSEAPAGAEDNGEGAIVDAALKAAGG